jgi:hypothetical protein
VTCVAQLIRRISDNDIKLRSETRARSAAPRGCLGNGRPPTLLRDYTGASVGRWIVNLERIQSLELKDDGEYQVVLETGARLRLSRRFRSRLQSRLGVGPG